MKLWIAIGDSKLEMEIGLIFFVKTHIKWCLIEFVDFKLNKTINYA